MKFYVLYREYDYTGWIWKMGKIFNKNEKKKALDFYAGIYQMHGGDNTLFLQTASDKIETQVSMSWAGIGESNSRTL